MQTYKTVWQNYNLILIACILIFNALNSIKCLLCKLFTAVKYKMFTAVKCKMFTVVKYLLLKIKYFNYIVIRLLPNKMGFVK